ncbi:hypothetical protein EB810_08450 [Altererythrobacter sp. FM1]|uniref:hypothetical protein n=1 Tax=Tsuneonella flava TaxID=2055955 RepID=UPI000C80E59C|nr:hypothetical protein [Tsuneonella flava]ROT95137.1 hypothetical protein EB810_08450 [Altererythrobacter sp. FM1]
MSGDRIEAATRRIESALTRIAAASEEVHTQPLSVSRLVDEHETLRETVIAALKELDILIADIEQ